MRYSRRRFLATAGGLGLSVLLSGEESRSATLPSTSVPLFEEVSPSVSGITWVHENAMSPDRHLPETLPPGCAFLDYDADGWMDIYLVNTGACDFYQPSKPLKNALYKNNRDGTFTDVTNRARVPGGTFGMGVAVGDYDNDGFPDLFITAYGRCVLYHNNGDGTFTDVTAGTDIEKALGKGLGVVATDVNNDGRMDLFVANDTVQNFLFMNRGRNKWEEVALASGVGFSDSGRARS